MKAGDPVFVIGTGGAVVKMDVPADVHRRERFDADLAKGALRLVDEADVEEVQHPRWPDATRFVLRKGAAPIAAPLTAPSPQADADPADPADPPTSTDADTGPATVEQPLKSANKAAWVDFAVSKGMDADAAKSMTKDALVEQFGG